MVRYLNANRDDLSSGLADLDPYRAVVILDELVSKSTRYQTAKLLCETGCRYMMAWGNDCSRWDDDVDQANRERMGFLEIPEHGEIMTTWHAEETLDEVLWFAKTCAYFDGFEWDEGATVLVHFGQADRESEYLRRFAEA